MKHFTYLLLLLTLGCTSGNESASRSDAANDVQETSDLPPIPVFLTDGTTRVMNKVEGKSILVLFQPGCDHCQREAASIEENLQQFEEYQLYFISSASAAENHEFAVTYKLSEAPNVHFGTTDSGNVLEHFGSIPTPSLYIYSDKGMLVKEFIGETPVEDILQAI